MGTSRKIFPCFGPYISLGPGRFEVRWDYFALASVFGGGGLVIMDVTAGAAELHLLEKNSGYFRNITRKPGVEVFEGTYRWHGYLSATFELQDEFEKMEVRLRGIPDWASLPGSSSYTGWPWTLFAKRLTIREVP
jgi:hypothetical protein